MVYFIIVYELLHFLGTLSPFQLYRLLETGHNGKKHYFGKEGMHEGSDKWKEEKHAHIRGIPNDVRVRVFAIHCNGW
jgi:hypothetical protein